MGTNTTPLLIVVAMAILVLTSVLAGVVYMTRGQKLTEIARDQAEDDALYLSRQELLDDEAKAKAYAAQVDIEIKTAPAPGTRADVSTATDQP